MAAKKVFLLKKSRIPFLKYEVYAEGGDEVIYYTHNESRSRAYQLYDKNDTSLIGGKPVCSFFAKLKIFDFNEAKEYFVRKDACISCVGKSESYVSSSDRPSTHAHLMTIVPKMINTRYSIFDSGTGDELCEMVLKPRDLNGLLVGEDIYKISVKDNSNDILILFICTWIDRNYSRREAGVIQKILCGILKKAIDLKG